MTPRPLRLPDDPPAVLALIRRAFAYMDGVVDPPSSMHRLTEAGIAEQSRLGEVWVIGDPVVACLFLTPKIDALYIGKLAVDAGQRGKGLSRRLLDHATLRAQARGLNWLELQTRVELLRNQQAFRQMGFTEVGRSAHDGYDRPTTITFRRPVPAAANAPG